MSGQDELITQLRATMGKLEVALGIIAEAIVWADAEGKVQWCNDSFDRLIGQRRIQVLGKSLIDLLPLEREGSLLPRDKHPMSLHLAGNSEISGSYECRGPSGSLHSFEVTGTRVRLERTAPSYVFLIRDVTERKKIDKMKNEFISTVNHELRTPLTSIRGSLGLIASGVAGPVAGQVKTLLDIAVNNCERLIRLIGDMLDIEKIESGRMEFKMAPLELSPLLQQALEANRSFGDQYQVSFRLVDEDAGLKVKADPDRIIQVLTNLLSNAVKFSPVGESVDLRARRIGNLVQVSVTDHGAGIPDEFRARIFEKFSQADSSSERTRGGTGLGLSISKAIIEKHGGKIGFEARQGAGTTFFFDLPEWKEADAELAPDADQRPRVLICEDDRDVAHLMRLMLAQGGIQADIAYSARQAKDLLTTRSYQALTLDILLPEESGAAFIKELKGIDSLRDLPVVVVSVAAQSVRKEFNGEAVNVVDWLDKPIDQARLLRAVRRAVGGSEKKGRSKILHVEDDVDTRKIVSIVLQKEADVVAAGNLRQARERLEQGRFDLLILDLSLPDGDGPQLLPVLGSLPGPPMPVVVYSAKEIDDEVTQSVAAALVKSKTSNENLLRTIQDLLKERPSRPSNS